MALSFYSYSETLGFMNSEMGLFPEQSEVADALLGFCEPFGDPHIPIDSLFDSPADVLVQTHQNPIHSFSQPSFSDPSVLTLPPDVYPQCDEFDLYPCPKRPRSCSDLYHPFDPMFDTISYKGPIVGSSTMAHCEAPEFLPEFLAPPPLIGSLTECNVEKKSSNGCSSVQSVAARVRRKRISEKTQELGRLIPGGNKMNTAEMFQAAFKYVKFLQAQVGILGVINSIQNCNGSPEVDEHLQVLLASTSIQEKLYGEGKCIVPKEAVVTLAEDHDIKLSPLISQDLINFIKSKGQPGSNEEKTS